MRKEFALEPGGPKRLQVIYPWNLASADVRLDGQRIVSFPTKADFQRGTTCKLPDGSLLSVRFGPVVGLPLFKGVHLIRNAAPVPGSAADPVPKWAWIFIILCAAIPVISVGGAVPTFLGVVGVSGTLSLARFRQWTAAKRAAGCALTALMCWSGFGLLLVVLRPTRASGWNPPLSRTLFMSSSPDKLIEDIDSAYTRYGYNEKAISQINDTLRRSCDRVEEKQCIAYLRTALLEIQDRRSR